MQDLDGFFPIFVLLCCRIPETAPKMSLATSSLLCPWDENNEYTGKFARSAKCLSQAASAVPRLCDDPSFWKTLCPKHLSVFAIDPSTNVFVVEQGGQKYVLMPDAIQLLTEQGGNSDVGAFIQRWTAQAEKSDALASRSHNIPFDGPLEISLDELISISPDEDEVREEWAALSGETNAPNVVHASIQQHGITLRESYIKQMLDGHEVINLGFAKKPL